jgi:hypothetical protein
VDFEEVEGGGGSLSAQVCPERLLPMGAQEVRQILQQHQQDKLTESTLDLRTEPSEHLR